MNRTECPFPVEALTRGPRHHLAGFYDFCPWNPSGRFALALQTEFIDRMPTGAERAVVGAIDTESGNQFVPLGETRAWNFQQANRLQWVPGSEDRLAYNVRQGDSFGAVLLDLGTRREERLSHPIYALSPDGSFSLTLDFARLQRMGGYGYPGVEDARADVPAPDDEGIRRVDLRSDRSEIVVPVSAVAAHGTPKPGRDGHHYLTHVTFNPAGTRICFLHRFWLKDGGFYTRLFTANPDGSDLHCLSEGTLSHFDWYDDERIMIWGRHRPLIARARQRNVFALPIFKPLLAFLRSQTRGFVRQRVIGDRYLLLTDRSGEVDSIGVGTLTGDGHPTRFPGSDWILTDTYTDETHHRTLILFDLTAGRRVDVGRFYALPDAAHWVEAEGDAWDVSGMRADLHPRWNRDQTRICIDSIHEGTHQLYAVDVRSVVGGS